MTTKPTHPENREHQAHSLTPGLGLESVTDDRLVELVKLLARKAAVEDYGMLLHEHARANNKKGKEQ
ncbi:hypothetical protein [Bradyrhizobium yuanmingense]|uniref:hypothetical protein n=1 Tax=Bradyrhizobium yuanmingense TaxID=108015 RepID=UPI0012FD7AF3|nr:hypothetical protein [Bradyrhizobium yuanmingense]